MYACRERIGASFRQSYPCPALCSLCSNLIANVVAKSASQHAALCMSCLQVFVVRRGGFSLQTYVRVRRMTSSNLHVASLKFQTLPLLGETTQRVKVSPSPSPLASIYYCCCKYLRAQPSNLARHLRPVFCSIHPHYLVGAL